MIAVLNHENIVKNPQIISKIKSFRRNYSWREVSFPSHIKDRRKVEANNNSILLYFVFVENDEEEIKQA